MLSTVELTVLSLFFSPPEQCLFVLVRRLSLLLEWLPNSRPFYASKHLFFFSLFFFHFVAIFGLGSLPISNHISHNSSLMPLLSLSASPSYRGEKSIYPVKNRCLESQCKQFVCPNRILLPGGTFVISHNIPKKIQTQTDTLAHLQTKKRITI